MATEVFLSVGRASTPAQESFVKAVERCLMERDLHPVALGRNEWSSEQPLIAVRNRMQQCAGTAVVAFERIRIESGAERDKRLTDERLPTIWNQIEASIAYSLGHPLLVIAESGLRTEGLLESRYDWMVESVPLEEAALRTAECAGVIDDWKRRVDEYQAGRADSERVGEKRDIGDKTIAELLGELRPAQARALIAGVIAVIGGAFSLGVLLH
jgi:hypothetical protein